MRFKKTIVLKDITPDTCRYLQRGQYIKCSWSNQIGRFIGFTPSGSVRIIWSNMGSYKKLQHVVKSYKRMCNRQNKSIQLSFDF